MELKIVQETGELTWLALVGMLDVVGTHSIEMKFVGHTCARGKPTIVDLAEMTFISSLGMGMLINCQKALKRKHAPIILLRPQSLVREALHRARLDELMPFAATEEEAIALALRKPE